MTNAVGHLHAVSAEERHLKVLETARTDLTCQKGEPLLTVIRESSADQLSDMRPLMIDNDGLNPALKSRLKLMLRAEHPELFTEQTWPWELEDVVYTTEAGLRRTQAQLQHIVDEEIPAVAKQSGEAASHGALSENSEYTAALEKRDQLFSRANTLEAELKIAKVRPNGVAEGTLTKVLRGDTSVGTTAAFPDDLPTADELAEYYHDKEPLPIHRPQMTPTFKRGG